MFFRNAIMATLAILLTVLLTSSTTNALAISNEKNINDMQETNYTIRDDVVILHSLVGEIQIPIPEEIKAELNKRKAENIQNQEKRFERLTFFGNSRMDDNIHSNTADFFECNEQAEVALSVHSENYRNWEAFFKRHSITDTMAVSNTLKP